ncbi:transcriptional regulator, GntR family [Roseovarius lutimaris]|uniref:Transcriptional regulator, GntR family n=1 Tax=Roseovarius lutimaris TaxID=1005928 RepID=A0A1I4ZGZ0_9RHOB|nr:FCD domain-containing protein [Roseovarius lutimaris]SFN49249.1 transcriptional regulator, GntR family [Roseovarius lutimaris]
MSLDDCQKSENASKVLAQVRQLIEAGGLDAEGKLPTERELAAKLNVGRRALRRALDALEAEGLIWRRQGKGTFVGQPPDPAGQLAAQISGEVDPLSVMEARLCVEPELAALCAERATPQDVARMRRLMEHTLNARDAEAAELWDGSLHRLIARVAGNPILLTAFALVDEVRSNQQWQDERDRARSPDLQAHYGRQHTAIVDAIAARDAKAARRAMRQHLRHLAGALKKLRREGAL